MSGFTLCLMLLRLTAASGQFFSYVTVRDGDEVTLPCQNATNDQEGCIRTNWLIPFNRAEVVTFGRVSEGAKDRLSVTESCSLVMKKVTVKDLGVYTCRQINSGKHQDSYVSLSVVHMTEQRNNDEVTLSCSVLTNGLCRHTVKWLNEGINVDNKDMKTSRSQCLVAVTFPAFYLKQKDNELFKCGVTDGQTKNLQLFTFSPRSSGEDTTTPRSITTAAPTTRITPTTSSTAPQEAPADCSVVNHVMLVLRVAELVLITVITVLLIRAPGNQRPPDDNTLSNSVRRPPVRRSGAAASQVNNDEDEDDGVVNYENFGDSSASVRLR